MQVVLVADEEETLAGLPMLKGYDVVQLTLDCTPQEIRKVPSTIPLVVVRIDIATRQNHEVAKACSTAIARIGGTNRAVILIGQEDDRQACEKAIAPKLRMVRIMGADKINAPALQKAFTAYVRQVNEIETKAKRGHPWGASG